MSTCTASRRCCCAITVFLLFVSSFAIAQNVRKKQPIAARVATHPVVARISDSRLAPLASSEKAVSYHAPFDSGDCSICHQSNDVKNPGAITTAGNEMCMNCHDDFRQTLARKYAHPPSQKNCLACHNPHNSKQPKLLLQEAQTLCTGCHAPIKQAMLNSPVKHDALTQGKSCVSCHNPHGANVEHLLAQLPMQLCLDCHGKDGLLDNNGKKLTNMKDLLAQNKNHHGPVASEDCTSCHKPHGGENFRLLTNAYPALFYSAYDAKNYSLCFGCHEEKAFTSAETTELTQFRDGSRNLHYVHVNKTELGRTCRACHEVHASTQDHQIRDAVPYGPKGWMLKINYTKTATGGSCSKTCHSTKTYNNTRKTAEAPAAPAAAPVAEPATAAAAH
ncbi:MAG TPA: cytochrome c3 family protein [Terriglobales bacterium]